MSHCIIRVTDGLVKRRIKVASLATVSRTVLKISLAGNHDVR